MKRPTSLAQPSCDPLYFDTLASPVGELRLVADDRGLRRVCFEHDRHPQACDAGGMRNPARLQRARRQLEEYFAGTRHTFDLELHVVGTSFQLQVWKALRGIPYGETLSYAGLAERIGQPSACRAVGAANGRNPLPIIVPCHRVIGSNGTLVGFGGGLDVKQALLALERANAPTTH